MLDHILVPLDTSALAETALPYAQHIVSESGLITLLTVTENIDMTTLTEGYPPVSPAGESGAEIHNSLEAETLEYLGSIALQIKASHPTVSIRKLVQVGDPGSVILKVAETQDVDTIVMSTRGRSGLSRVLFGSVTQKVIYSATCPVFVVPGKSLEESAELSEEKQDLLQAQQAAVAGAALYGSLIDRGANT